MNICGGLSALDSARWAEIEPKVKLALADLADEAEAPKLEFSKLISVQQQVVAGIMYHVTAEIIHGDKIKECQLRICEQPWMNKRIAFIDFEEKSFQFERNDKRDE